MKIKRKLWLLIPAAVILGAALLVPAPGDAGAGGDFVPLSSQRNWRSLISFPTAAEIDSYDRYATQVAPYIAGWMKTDSLGRYTEYCIDFKADIVPPYTYCSVSNFDLDYSSLSGKYAKIETGTIFGYAGFQQGAASERPNTILSLWDVCCTDRQGRVTTIRAKQVYPAPGADSSFDGEGEGAHCLVKYDWKPGSWYRMLLQCGRSETTGNTTLQQWVQDLTTGNWTYLCEYDLGAPNVAFVGGNAVFLENFAPSYAGEVRTMEVCNARAHRENGGWTSIRSGWFLQNFDHPGSYRYGADADMFWIVTTGITGKAGRLQGDVTLTVKNGLGGSPY